jgi:hypothetical protein
MSYPKNAASPPPIFATVVKAADGTPITVGVAAKYSVGAHQGAGGGTLHGEDNGQWSYIPTQAETNVSGFGIQFYHADAVGTGPTVSVVTDTLTASVGTLVALDGGAATIGGMLTKMADDSGGAAFDATTHSLAKLSAAVVTGTPSQIYASANTLERGTARQAASPWATGGVASTYADTVATDTAWLACSPVNSTATVNGVTCSMWQTLTFLAGAARANYVSVVGYFSGGASPRVCDAYYYDYVTTTWKLLTSTANRMNNASADATYGPWYLPAAAQKNQTAGDGEVKLAFVSAGLNTADILHANLVFLSASVAGPSASDIAAAVYNRMLPVTVDGVWLDTVNGVDGAEGLAGSPVLTIAGAYTRCAELNVKRIYFKAGSNTVPITLTQSAAGWRFIGPGVIDIAGFSVADAIFENCYTVSNTGAAVGDDVTFHRCGIGNGAFRHGYWYDCAMKNATALTMYAGDEYHFFNCKDATPDAGDPATFTFAAGCILNLRDYSGGVQIKSMADGDTAKLDGALRLIVHSSATGGAITLRGSGPEPTVAAQFTAGGGTVNDDAMFNVQQVNAEADTALSDYGPSTFDATTDTVLLNAAQGPVTFTGQVKIVADVADQGALDVENINASGFGQFNHSDTGIGVMNYGETGMVNSGTDYGIENQGSISPINPMLAQAGEAGTAQIAIQRWLRFLFRKDAGLATDLPSILPEINLDVDGGGAGTYDNTTDSLEARADLGLNAQQKLDVNAEVDTALTDYGANKVAPPSADDVAAKILKTPANLLATDGTGRVTPDTVTAAAPSTADIKTKLEEDGGKLDHLWETTENDGGVRRFTANALELAPTGGTAPNVVQIRQEMDANSTKLADILTDTGTTIPGLLAGISAGTGTGTYTDTVTDGVNPVDGVRVVLYTDSAMTHLAYQAYTDALGVFVIHPDPGTYYRQVELAGYIGTQGVQVVVT